MYTVVFKQRIENLTVFEVFKKSFFGRQTVVGNVFCIKDENNIYKATSSFYMASWPKRKKPVRWDAGKLAFYLEDKALWICNEIIEQRHFKVGNK